jgi:glycosyltransferase involved in cell wall biosynthesis
MDQIMRANRPLVSVGLPTYNRADTLRRAIESVLSQDYPSLELIICDNASSDGTQQMCEEYLRKDNRVIYRRQPTNLGPHENFQRALAESHGEFFMWLGDDDWIEQQYYLSACLDFICSNSDCELVCGRVRYVRDGEVCFVEEDMNLTQDSVSERVLNYFRLVGMNGIFYGLMRRASTQKVINREGLGGDWLLIPQLAALGKVHTVPDLQLNRSIAGASSNIGNLAHHAGHRGVVARHPHDYIAMRIFKDIAWDSPVYAPLGHAKRLILGLRSAAAVVRRYGLGTWRPPVATHFDKLRARLVLRTRLKLFVHKYLYKGE